MTIAEIINLIKSNYSFIEVESFVSYEEWKILRDAYLKDLDISLYQNSDSQDTLKDFVLFCKNYK